MSGISVCAVKTTMVGGRPIPEGHWWKFELCEANLREERIPTLEIKKTVLNLSVRQLSREKISVLAEAKVLEGIIPNVEAI